MEAEASVFPKIKFKDDKFSIDRIGESTLIISIGKKDIQFCVIDNLEKRCALIEYYEIDTFTESPEKSIKAIIESHEWLQAGFWGDVKVIFSYLQYTLVAEELYIEGCKEDYLSFAAGHLGGNSVETYLHSEQGIVSVFSGNSEIIEFLVKQYTTSNFKVVHQSSALIEAGLNDVSEDNEILIDVNSDQLNIIYLKNKKLYFSNDYEISSPEDILYFVSLTYSQFNLDHKSTILKCWGDVDLNGDQMKLLKRYFGNIMLGKRPSSLYFSYSFDEAYDHKFRGLLAAQYLTK